MLFSASSGTDPKRIRFFIVLGLIVLFLVIFANQIFIILEPTERGVLFRRYTTGLDTETVYPEGLNVIAPWNKMIIFDISQKKMEETMDVLSSNGLSIQTDVSVRYAPVVNEIGMLYESFKTDYSDRLVRQELRSAVREVVGRYTPEELYSTKREIVQADMKEIVAEVLGRNHVELNALLIRSVKLPPSIKEAIEAKLNQEQQSLAYQFRLEKEQSEAERKRIQAEGEARANRIVNESLTPELLKMRGIEATTNLAKSNNSKVVVIGSGKDGLPLILGGNN